MKVETRDKSFQAWRSSSGFPRRLTKKMTGYVDKREGPASLGDSFKIRLDKDLDRLFTDMDFDAHRRVAKVHLMAAAILSRMMAYDIFAPLPFAGVLR